MQIDRSNQGIVGLDLYPVAERHQAALIEALIRDQISSWKTYPEFTSAAVHRSLDGVRVFVYSQWQSGFDHRALNQPVALSEFYPPDTLQLEVTASRPLAEPVLIESGDRITHLAEFRMMPTNQPEMVKRTASELDRAMSSPGLISASFHRSLDGTRMFNYGQWESQEAFEAILKQPGFNPEQPYWAGLARNEFHLYQVVFVQEPE